MGIALKGITWAHSRGYTPLVAASHRYQELNPQVDITWHKRSLQQFADYPLEKLVHDYDLLIIDYPWTGCAASFNHIVPVSDYLSAAYMDNQQANTVGHSFESYSYLNKQWALPIDAATPVASYRKDLLDFNNIDVPTTWEQVLSLAQKGKVAMPAIPIDILMNFYTFCIALGEPPFTHEHEVVSQATAAQAMEIMRDLYGRLPAIMFTYNPIQVAECMTQSNEYWYCPFAYGYTNYARTGYAPVVLQYDDVVTYNGQKFSTTIGGTGIAVSAHSKYIPQSMEFLSYVCAGSTQCTLYVQHGGQPGHGAAWNNDGANELTHNFFKNCLPAMQRGYLRPRYNGYLHFQDRAGTPLQQYMMGRLTANDALAEMNIYYRQSKKIEKEAGHGVTS